MARVNSSDNNDDVQPHLIKDKLARSLIRKSKSTSREVNLEKNNIVYTKNKNKKEIRRDLNDDFEDSTPCSYSVHHETEDELIMPGQTAVNEDEMVTMIHAIPKFVTKTTLCLSPSLSPKKGTHEGKKRLIEFKDAIAKKKNRMEVKTRVATVKKRNRMEVKTGDVKNKKHSDTETILTPEEDNASDNDSYDDYEIPRDFTREFVNSNKRKLKRCKPELYGFGNHRKGRGFEGELLMLYTNGKLFWGYLSGPLEDFVETTSKYLDDNNLTCEMMGFGLYYEMKKIEENRLAMKQKK